MSRRVLLVLLLGKKHFSRKYSSICTKPWQQNVQVDEQAERELRSTHITENFLTVNDTYGLHC